VQFGRPEVGEIESCLPDKKKISAHAAALTSARSAWIVPKICQGQLQTIYAEYAKFHPNPFTSGGVIAERMIVIETHHKVFPILGEAIASSPSKNQTTQERNGNKHIKSKSKSKENVNQVSTLRTAPVCMHMCTTVVHNTAQNSSDNLPSTIIAQMSAEGKRINR